MNIVDKVVEPIKQYKFTSEDLHQVKYMIYKKNYLQCSNFVLQFLSAYSQAVSDGSVNVDKELNSNFTKFIKTLSVIILTFYKV